MATPLSSFLPYIVPYAPGVPRTVAQSKLLDAAIELCERSLYLRQTLSAFDLVLNTDSYVLAPPTDHDVVMATSVIVNGNPIGPAAEERIDSIDAYWRTGISGMPSMWYQPSPTTIKFNRLPDETVTAGILVEIAVKPTRTATTVDDELYTDWVERLANGALWRLLSMRGVEWADENLAHGLYGPKWNAAISQAKARAAMGKTRAATYAKLRTV